MTAGRTDTAAGSSAAACPRPPALTAPDLSRLRDGEADELTAGEMVEDLELVEADLSGGDLSALTLLSCRFSEVFANDTDLAAARLVDCRLERLSATYLHSPRSTWRTVELIDSRIGAWELYDADVESLLMEDCRLGFTNLAGTTVRDLLIRATRIDELDLSGIDAQRVRSLAGATVSSGQLSELAPLLAQHLGLRVTDQDHAQNATTRSKRA